MSTGNQNQRFPVMAAARSGSRMLPNTRRAQPQMRSAIGMLHWRREDVITSWRSA